jgi:uncharacterized membrane protein
MIDKSLTDYLFDWVAPIGTITLSISLVDTKDAWLIAKETAIIASIVLGIVTNAIRLYKTWKDRHKDEE